MADACKVHVGNLNFDTTEEQLREWFTSNHLDVEEGIVRNIVRLDEVWGL
jgi:RNA recognition motif-containing protein